MKKKPETYVSPNHWSRQEPDGLCQWHEWDATIGKERTWRGPWPENMMAVTPSPVFVGIPQSKRHEHTTDCTVPAGDVPTLADRTSKHVDGLFEYWGRTTAMGCRQLGMPIFTPVQA